MHSAPSVLTGSATSAKNAPIVWETTIFAQTAIPAVPVPNFAIAGKDAAIVQRFVKDAGRPAPIVRM